MTDVDLDDAMTLADGFGVVPKDQRNAGYEKLDYDAGKGGFILAQDDSPPAANDSQQAFLAGVAAGADPQALAKELLGSSTPSRARRGR